MIIQEGHAMATLIKWLPESFYYQVLCVLIYLYDPIHLKLKMMRKEMTETVIWVSCCWSKIREKLHFSIFFNIAFTSQCWTPLMSCCWQYCFKATLKVGRSLYSPPSAKSNEALKFSSHSINRLATEAEEIQGLFFPDTFYNISKQHSRNQGTKLTCHFWWARTFI